MTWNNLLETLKTYEGTDFMDQPAIVYDAATDGAFEVNKFAVCESILNECDGLEYKNQLVVE